MSDMAITTEGLTKIYSKIRAVDGASLNVPRGAVYGYLGRNGAGKTTTIKMLLGLTRPTAGSARVLGMNVPRDQVAVLQRTAFVSENKTLYPSLTPTELVRFTRGFYPSWSDGAVEKYARVLEIPMKQRFGKLSRGNQTKVWLLLALSQGADLMILDEPTAGLDPVIVDELLHVLIEDALARGCTIFFSSHHLSNVEQIADWVGIIDEGKLLLEARLDDIKNEFRLITAVGNFLPTELSPQVMSAVSDGSFYKYVVTKNADGFAAELRQNGASGVDIAALSLREIFLQLVGKEQPCTSGNTGATTAPVSSPV